MKKLLKIALVSSITLLFFSCYYDEFPQEVDVLLPPDTVVSYASDIAPIFVTYNCTQCHNATGQSPNLTAGSAYNTLVPVYVSAGNANTSDLYIMLAINDHRNVDANSLALIKKWIDDGAENN